MTPFGPCDRAIDQFLADAVQTHSMRTRGKRAKHVTVVFEDDTMSVLPLPGGAVIQRTAPSADDCPWPPEEGWAVRPGEASFDGTRFKLVGKPLAILRELIRKPGTPVAIEKLKFEAWHEEPDSVDDSNLHGQVSILRKKIRDAFGLEKDIDPIPNVGGAYKLIIR